jgi:NADH:flavin oxidoreductase / NADH oxidase family
MTDVDAARSMLFEPVELRELTLPTWVVVSPMCQYSAVNGTAQPWHWFHIGGLPLSGAGLVIMEATGVEARGQITPDRLGLYSDDNEAANRSHCRSGNRRDGFGCVRHIQSQLAVIFDDAPDVDIHGGAAACLDELRAARAVKLPIDHGFHGSGAVQQLSLVGLDQAVHDPHAVIGTSAFVAWNLLAEFGLDGVLVFLVFGVCSPDVVDLSVVCAEDGIRNRPMSILGVPPRPQS